MKIDIQRPPTPTIDKVILELSAHEWHDLQVMADLVPNDSVFAAGDTRQVNLVEATKRSARRSTFDIYGLAGKIRRA